MSINNFGPSGAPGSNDEDEEATEEELNSAGWTGIAFMLTVIMFIAFIILLLW